MNCFAALTCKELVRNISTNFKQKLNINSNQLTFYLSKYDSEVHTNTNLVELMIRVEPFNAELHHIFDRNSTNKPEVILVFKTTVSELHLIR